MHQIDIDLMSTNHFSVGEKIFDLHSLYMTYIVSHHNNNDDAFL